MTSVYVSTPSRLHFGLLRLHEREGRSFGGLGMMIDRPRVELDLAAADEWCVTGPGRHRAREFAERALANVDAADKPAALRLRVASIVPQHRGLGGGTQLALAVAAGAASIVGLPPASADELAEAGRSRRPQRRGQPRVRPRRTDLGTRPDRRIWCWVSSVTAFRFPTDWRIVLVAPRQRRGLSGLAERRAFDRLPPVPAEVTEQLETLAERQILPAAKAGALDEFGEAVYEYGRLAGECFASVQGGPYASADIAECVAAIRAFGVRGVGQSSWGPTVFAITANHVAAAELVARLHADPRWSAYDFETAAPDNRGAVVEAEPRQAISVGSVSGS